MLEKNFTKYETARILGARALQISMNAPLLIKINQENLERIKFDSLKIAEIEFNSNILPISVEKPFPKKKQEELKRARDYKLSEKKKEKIEMEEAEEIAKEGEIMVLVNPEDEQEEESVKEGEE